MEDGTEWTAHAGAQMKIVVWYLGNKNRQRHEQRVCLNGQVQGILNPLMLHPVLHWFDSSDPSA